MATFFFINRPIDGLNSTSNRNAKPGKKNRIKSDGTSKGILRFCFVAQFSEGEVFWEDQSGRINQGFQILGREGYIDERCQRQERANQGDRFWRKA